MCHLRPLVDSLFSGRNPGLIKLAGNLLNLLLGDLWLDLDHGLRLLGSLLFRDVDRTQLCQEFVCGRHWHATEIWDKMGARSMAGEIALRALSSVLAAEREHVSTVTAPVGTDVCNGLEPVRDAMVDFHFVAILPNNEKDMH